MKKMMSGRSMTEMLGVLAIIGVLSIGALVGLKYAFMKHQSNLIIEDVKLAGFVVKDGLFETMPMSEEKSLSGYFTPQTSYPFTTFKETDTSYAVVIDGIAENLCLDLKKRKVEWLEEIRANGQENACRAGDGNSMSFFFNESLNTELTGCQNDTECGECGRCENRKCVYDTGEVVSGNTCMSCDTSITINSSTLSSCRQCKNRIFIDGAAPVGRCSLCSIAIAVYPVYKSDCMACGNRFWIPYTSGNPDLVVCRFCDGTVTADGTGCEWTCPAGQFGSDNACHDCSDTTALTHLSSLSTCRQCGNRFYAGEAETGGGCALCSYTGGVPSVRKSDCMACGNRYWLGTYADENSLGACRLCDGTVTADGMTCEWSCPVGQFGSDNACHDCSDTTALTHLSSLSTCRQCPNRIYYGSGKTGGGCTLCSYTGGINQVRKSDCMACGNRYWLGTYADENSLGSCYLCPTGQVPAPDGLSCVN